MILLMLLTLRLLLMDWSWLGLNVTWLVGERCTQLKHSPPTPCNWLSCEYEYCANIDINLHIAFKQKYEFEFLANISRGLHSWKTRMLTKKALGGELEGGWHNEGWDGEWRRRWSWEINLVHCGRAASQPHRVPLSKKGGQGTEGAGRVMVIWHKWIERVLADMITWSTCSYIQTDWWQHFKSRPWYSASFLSDYIHFQTDIHIEAHRYIF